jgi:hypothetical protein
MIAPPLLLGCGSPDKEEAPAAGRIETVGLSDLPKLGNPIPSLDDGRIEVAPPEGWHIPPRSSQWIVRFQATATLPYPSVIITAEDYENVFDVTKDNVNKFAEIIASALKEDKPTASRAISPAPIEIGPFVGVAYRSRGAARYRGKRIVVERLIVETVAAGRKYTIELRTRERDLDEYRPCLLAVAGGIRFVETDTAEPPEKPTEPATDLEYEDEL